MVLLIENVYIEKESLVDYSRITRKRKVNGESTLAFSVVPTDLNVYAWPKIENETRVSFMNENYYIKDLVEKNKGRKSTKQIESVHEFYWKMIDCVQYKLHTGSITMNNVMNFVFENTPYAFNIVDLFPAQEFDNLGGENCLALFVKVLNRYKAEFYLNGNNVHIVKERGAKTNTQFRYSMNIKAITKDVTTKNLSNVMRGFGGERQSDGRYPVERTVRDEESIRIFGERHGTPVYDERYTTNEGMDERLRNDMRSEPELTLTIDFVDLRASGYPHTAPREGDYVWVIYEPMGFTVSARVVEIHEEFEYRDREFIPVKTNVTLSNVEQKATNIMTRFENTSKTVSDLTAGKLSLPYNAMANAVQAATRALQNAQTELLFENGILAIDKTNVNNIVLFNSAGFGISDDAGRTFKTAITGAGIVADVITAGTIRGINISGVNFTGDDMELRNQLKMMNEYSGVVGEYDYGPSVIGDTYNPRFFTGSYRLGTNHVRFLADTYNVNANGSKGSHRGYTETYFGSDYVKMRNYPNSSDKTMRRRVDISADKFQISDNWNDVDSGVVMLPNGEITAASVEARGYFKAGREMDVVGGIIGRSSLLIHGDSLFRSFSDFQGSAIFRSDVDMQGDVILRTSMDLRGPATLGSTVDIVGRLGVGGAVDITGSIISRSSLDQRGGALLRSTLDTQGYATFRSVVDIRGELRSSAVYNKTSSVSANVYVDSAGTVGRATSARKYKDDIKDITTDGYAERLLSLKLKSWIDKAEKASGRTSLRRYQGLIAEDVFDAGLGAYVTYDDDMKEIEGIQYDRLWTLLIPIIKKLDDKIKDLERRGLINGTIRIG
ncbi:phage tail protein [Alkalicoccobacillus gibsonii]|uniref:phage tail protein n=1 Tax=Alkalicoccobacillus gibsonii TaxID=79881 RepID=UPI003F7C27C7